MLGYIFRGNMNPVYMLIYYERCEKLVKNMDSNKSCKYCRFNYRIGKTYVCKYSKCIISKKEIDEYLKWLEKDIKLKGIDICVKEQNK